MSTSMLRSSWRGASISSAWNSAAVQAQAVAGPSRLRFAMPRCPCGEELFQSSRRSSKRWMSSTRASWQATTTTTHSSTPPTPPLHGMGINKNVPPPATVESTPPPSSPQQATTKPPAPRPSRPARREIKAQKAAISLVSVLSTRGRHTQRNVTDLICLSNRHRQRWSNC